MLTRHFADLVHHHFDDIHDAETFFHVQPITVHRWLSGEVPVNPMAEKLMNIHARGYLPLDYRWNGFKVHFDRTTLVTPKRREFNPKELLSFAYYWRDERHGRIDSPKFYPPKEHPLPFRGGRRMPAKPWVPTKFK